VSGSSFPPKGSTAAKHGSIAISVLGAAAAVWARFIAVEQRQEGFVASVVEVRKEVDRLSERVNALERDRELWSEVQALKTDLAVVAGRLDTIELKPIKRRK